MKSIKLLKYILAISLTIAMVTACDNKLNEPLENQILLEETDYMQSEDMFRLMTGAYATLYHLQWETYPLISVRGDDVNAAGDQEPLHRTDSLLYDRNFWIYNSSWLNLYSDIITWHGTMEELEKYKEFAPNPAVADQYIAEVKVMRAFELIQLVRLWGDILIPMSSQTQELYDAPVATSDEVYQHISDQMDEAIPLLPSVRPNERTDIPGGVTRYTALAVKAMANLELKNFQEVADATNEIIADGGFSLMTDYYELFKIPGKLSSENLLELQYSDFGQSSGENRAYLYAFFGPASWTPAVPNASQGWGFWEPTVEYIKFMLDRGEQTRLETSVLFTPDGIAEIESDPDYATLPGWISNTTKDGDVINNNSRTMFSSGKHYLPSNQLTPGRTSYGTNKNFIAIRYAEILLMHAEALVQGASGDAMTADQAINEVRMRAGLTGISGATLQTVLDEKFAEFGMEWGIRFYDLMRYDMGSELNRPGIEFNIGERYLPYPLQQVDLLPQLAQAEEN